MNAAARPDPTRRAPRLRHPMRLGLAAAALAAGALAWYFGLNRAGEVRYATALVDTGSVTKSVSASGTVNPVLTIIVGSYVSGVIQHLYCDFNTQVVVGQVCAKIDPRPYQVVVDQDQAALATAKAQLDKDRANLDYAKRNADRLAWLVGQDSASRDAADLARSAYDQARAQIALDEAVVAQRTAALEAATVNLGYTSIRSPVNGTVVARNVTQGQTVAASFQTPTLFLIATDLTAMQVDTSVSEGDIGQLRIGQTARFTVEAYPSRQFTGKVTQIRQDPQTVQNVVTYDVLVSVDNRDRLLLPGMTATLRIVTADRRGVLRVPDPALRYHPAAAPADGASAAPPPAGRQRVWVLRDGRPAPVLVTVGLDDDAYSEITGGDLHAGERVIVGEIAGDAAQATRRGPRLGF